MPAIYVASGHSSTDPGAVGNGLKEANKNVEIVVPLVEILRRHVDAAAGLTAVHTDLDVGNPPAGGGVEDSRKHRDVALYIEFHHNSAGSKTARGYECYGTGTGRSIKLARWIHDEHLNLLRRFDPAIKDRGVKEAKGTRAEFIVTKSQGAACLAEMLFVSNADDAAVAKRPDYGRSVAEVTARGLIEFGASEGLWTVAFAQGNAAPSKPRSVWIVSDGKDRYYGQRPTMDGAIEMIRGCLTDSRFSDGARINEEPL